MSFIPYVLQYYQSEIDRLETIDFAKIEKQHLLTLLTQASNLKKFLNDIREEGYIDTVQEFEQRLNVSMKLENLLSEGLSLIGQSEASLFYLHDEFIDVNFDRSNTGVKVYEMTEYLDYLDSLTMADIDLSLIEDHEGWKLKTDLIIEEMVKYLFWIEGKVQSDASVVFLLRDTLLLYLGFRMINQRTKAIPLLVGRKFLSHFGDENRLFHYLYKPIYQILADNKDISLEDFISRYKDLFNAEKDQELHQLKSGTIRFLRNYLEGEEYIFVESGVQGSILLFLISLLQKRSKFYMYTTVPWLHNIYEQSIFQKNYNYLREMETLLCQDQLFNFSHVAGDRVFIKEFQNDLLNNMAYYEIVRFKEVLKYKLLN